MAKKTARKLTARPGKRSRKSRPTRIDLKNILVPIDFSEHSKKALQYAIPFARQFRARISLIYVVEPTVYPADFSFGQVGFPAIEDELRKRGGEELDDLLRHEIGKRVPAKRAIRTGKAFYEILQYAKEEQVDLIIIATHGHSGLEHALFGSTAEKVVRKAPCPVLVVRSGEREFVK
ncbi:MAG: universal stress protein [Ignavibacteriales bacterium]|nr:universal stress protein [Ignavibacteriales bacterium]